MSDVRNIPTFGLEIRETEFTLKEGVTFVNHGAYGVTPRRVLEAQQRFMDEMNSFPDVWFKAERRQKQERARLCVAEFINADPQDVVFVQNATTGTNSVLKSLRLEPEDIILCNDNTYTAVKYTCEATKQLYWLKDVRTEYLTMKFPIHSEDEVVEMYREYLEKNPKVKVAVFDHIASPSAIKMPLEKLIPLCQEFGVLSLIDGAHALGHIPVNMKELGADFYAGNLHKWLFAPRGCAILYVKKEHQDWVKPVVASHGHFAGFQEDFLLQGTRDDSPYCAVPEAIEFHRAIGGFPAIQEYSSRLLDEATDLLTESWNTEKLQIPESMEAPCMRMVRLPKINRLSTNEEVKQQMVDNLYFHNIATQITIVDGKVYVRLSANIYNTKEDYNELCKVILEQHKQPK